MIFWFGSDSKGNSYTITDLEMDTGLAFAPEIVGTAVIVIVTAIINMITGIDVKSIMLCCGFLIAGFFWAFFVKPKLKTVIFFILLFLFASVLLQGIDCEVSYYDVRHSGYTTRVDLGLYYFISLASVKTIIALSSIAVATLIVPMIVDFDSVINSIILAGLAVIALIIFIFFIILRGSINPAGRTSMFFIIKSFIIFAICTALSIVAFVTRD